RLSCKPRPSKYWPIISMLDGATATCCVTLWMARKAVFEATPGAPANAGLGITPRCSPVSCWLARHSANSSLLIEPHAVYGGPTGGVDVRDKTGSKTLGRAVGVEDVYCSPAREGDAYHASFVKQLQPPVAVTTRLQAGQF